MGDTAQRMVKAWLREMDAAHSRPSAAPDWLWDFGTSYYDNTIMTLVLLTIITVNIC